MSQTCLMSATDGKNMFKWAQQVEQTCLIMQQLDILQKLNLQESLKVALMTNIQIQMSQTELLSI